MIDATSCKNLDTRNIFHKQLTATVQSRDNNFIVQDTQYPFVHKSGQNYATSC